MAPHSVNIQWVTVYMAEVRPSPRGSLPGDLYTFCCLFRLKCICSTLFLSPDVSFMISKNSLLKLIFLFEFLSPQIRSKIFLSNRPELFKTSYCKPRIKFIYPFVLYSLIFLWWHFMFPHSRNDNCIFPSLRIHGLVVCLADGG